MKFNILLIYAFVSTVLDLGFVLAHGFFLSIAAAVFRICGTSIVALLIGEVIYFYFFKSVS